MAMEKKQRAAAESGVLLLVVAGILVALNALSALGRPVAGGSSRT